MEKADIFPVAHIGTAACVSVISVWWTLLLTVNRQIQLTHMRSFSHFLQFSLCVCVCVRRTWQLLSGASDVDFSHYIDPDF